MHPGGVNLRDVWDDIPPVRHLKFKSKKRRPTSCPQNSFGARSNLPRRKEKLGPDPFGGAGTTFDVCEAIGRRWIGIELLDCEVIVERLTTLAVNHHVYDDYIESDHGNASPKPKREKHGRVKPVGISARNLTDLPNRVSPWSLERHTS